MQIQGHKVIVKVLVGSHAYGTNIEGSDMDYKGVFIQDPTDTYINGYKEQIEVSKDEVYFEVGRFLNLCRTNNPTMLELLYAPDTCISYKTTEWDYISKYKAQFVSKSCRHSFGGYAIDQICKARGLDRKANWEKHRIVRKSVEDFCWVYSTEGATPHYNSIAVNVKEWAKEENRRIDCCGLVKLEHMRDTYLLFYDYVSEFKSDNPRFSNVNQDVKFKGIACDTGNDVHVSEIPSYMKPSGLLFFNRDAYSIHCREYREYEHWQKEKNEQRYIDIKSHGQKIDGKNLLHCVRLIDMATEIATEGTVNVHRPNCEHLINIRKGKYDLNTILEDCEAKIAAFNKVYDMSTLPERADPELVNRIIKNIKTSFLTKYLI